MTQGEKLKMLRLAINVGQDKFAEPLDVNKATISNLERDMYELNEKMLRRIHEEYNVNPYFFSNDYVPDSKTMTVEEIRKVEGEEEMSRKKGRVKYVDETNVLLQLIASQQQTIIEQSKTIAEQSKTITILATNVISMK